MKKYITIYFLLSSFSLFSQEDNRIIKESTYHFSLDSIGNFDGHGSDFVKQKISESQFFLIGEQHDIHLIEIFVKSLIPFLKENGYNHYATEIGPIASKQLIELKQNSTSLNSYYTKYTEQINIAPFGFFSTKEEEATLMELIKNKINLWGIDFENYGSYLSHIDEIYKNADKTKVSKSLYNKVYSFVESEYKKGKNDYNPNLMNNILSSSEVSHFLDLAKNTINSPLIEQFKLSLEINHQQTLGFWQHRVDNMKNNFAKYYNHQSDNEDTVKAFIKLGAVHTARGTSFSGNIEVGNMIYELANVNQSKSFSLITFPRYILNEETGEIEDEIEEETKELLKYVSSDRWAVIDLNKLKELSIQNKISLSKNIISYIQKYDAIVIPPATKYSEKNY